MKSSKQEECVSWQFVRFLTRQVRCDLWVIEVWPVYSKHALTAFNSESEQSWKECRNHKTWNRKHKQFTIITNINWKTKSNWNVSKINTDSTRLRVHRKPSRHKIRGDTRSYKWLEASQRQNGSWVLKFWCPTGCNGSEGRLYGL